MLPPAVDGDDSSDATSASIAMAGWCQEQSGAEGRARGPTTDDRALQVAVGTVVEQLAAGLGDGGERREGEGPADRHPGHPEVGHRRDRRPTLHGEHADRQVDRLDEELGRELPYAFHHEFGFLTSCPTNTGTGLRASVLVHLPGLVLTKEISKVLHALGQVGLTFRGLYGEGSEVVGNFFQISNQTTLGKSEDDLISHLDQVVRRVIRHEREARQVLLRDAGPVTQDKIWRAYGLLRYARSLSFEELMNLLSGVRLGLSLKLLPELRVYTLNKLMIFTQPAHLEEAAGRDLTPAERFVMEKFDFRPAAIIERLQLLRPIYRATAACGHFGRAGFSWENTDKAAALAALVFLVLWRSDRRTRAASGAGLVLALTRVLRPAEEDREGTGQRLRVLRWSKQVSDQRPVTRWHGNALVHDHVGHADRRRLPVRLPGVGRCVARTGTPGDGQPQPPPFAGHGAASAARAADQQLRPAG